MNHPYFDDHRSIEWHLSLDDGRRASSASGKRIFVQVGQKSCGGTRALIEKTIWKDEIAEYVNAHFESVAIDLDALDAAASAAPGEVNELLSRLPKRAPTPLCVYLATDGRILHSTAGGRPAAVFLQDLVQAIGKK